jgi:hypothetical protein
MDSSSPPPTGAPELVLVYNADSGLLNALGDALHKLIAPQTYPCSLCALTYGSVRMRPRWRRFIASLGVRVRFLHADELRRTYGDPGVPLPAGFVRRGGALEPWLSKAEIDGCKTLDELEQLILDRLRHLHSAR